MKHVIYALLFSFIISGLGTLLLISPAGRHLEENLGLAILFKLRGRCQAPDDVVIINIDEEPDPQHALSGSFDKLSRTDYAELIRRLRNLGAAVIVFDVHFVENRQPTEDSLLAREIRQAENVILAEKLVRHTFDPSRNNSDNSAPVEVERLIPPIPVLAESARALAPFPLPKVPIRINQAWTFTSIGDIPTLPVTALQAHALKRYNNFFTCLQKFAPAQFIDLPVPIDQTLAESGLVEAMRRTRGILRDSDPIVIPENSPSALCTVQTREDIQIFQALIDVYTGENDMYINYYGPPATLATYSLKDILSDVTNTRYFNNRINDAVVFVGAARASWSDQKDGFFTVFTQPDGLDLSGVEVAATIFSNLRDIRPLKPLRSIPSFLILLTMATLACLASFLLAPVAALYTLAGIISCCLIAMCFFFSMSGIWSPVVIPLTVIPVGAYFSGSSYTYFRSRRERKHVQKALKLYLPDTVVEEISRDPSFIKSADRKVHAICLLSDAVNYTTLSERLSPEELGSLMKRYFQVIFRQVNNNDGVVTNMIGDTMLAMWPSPKPHSGLKEKACRAALHILSAVEEFNCDNPEYALPTRLGLHSGYLLMGNIGAEGHYEYAPVGDIVNTASRIEGLNKLLGTWILASGETVGQINGVARRFMGTFLLSGKSNPVNVYQLLPGKMDITSAVKRVHGELFPEALDLMQKRKWTEAAMTLQQCLDLQPEDGPSRFYLERCMLYHRNPPATDWQGIISVSK